ncbi:hypothetical protein SCA6_008909 [Theobroma cacao]
MLAIQGIDLEKGVAGTTMSCELVKFRSRENSNLYAPQWKGIWRVETTPSLVKILSDCRTGPKESNDTAVLSYTKVCFV